MYAYVWNPETGGFRLIPERLIMSKEPRPVYAGELDILGFDKHFQYDPQMDVPYMWAEANNYWYRGQQIAKTVGGSLYTPPKLVLLEAATGIETLLPVDIPAMVEENAEILKALVQDTIKKIYDTYKKYRSKVEIFFVSYSGGKDSEVMLDLVQRAIPHSDFSVIFSDTGMEFPDTYKAVENIKKKCEEWDVRFYTARSHLKPEDSWKIFGPPSRTIRWCCSVHKTAPQIVKLREILGKSSFREMAFIGVRGDESQKRSSYEYISYAKKHNGQYSCYPILNWNSAEVYIYQYSYDIYINNAYKLGNGRVGCLVCPMSSNKSEYMNRISYTDVTDRIIDIIKNTDSRIFCDDADMIEFYNFGGWKARKNGRDLKIFQKYDENEIGERIKLSVFNPNVDWKEWCKTVGTLVTLSEGSYMLKTHDKSIEFYIKYNKNGYDVYIENRYGVVGDVSMVRFKQVFRKSAYCIFCKECEAECHHGSLVMKDGKLRIDDRCTQCGDCHKPALGCLVYKSTVLPKGGIMSNKSGIDCYQNQQPKEQWFRDLFCDPEEFLLHNNLGPNMITGFRKFLRDVLIIPERSKNKMEITQAGKLILSLGIDESKTWGVILVNGCYSTVLRWFVKNIKPHRSYSRDEIKHRIKSEYPTADETRVSLGYVKFLSLPFGTMLGLGKVTEEGKETLFTRGTWLDPEALVILYALYKFAVACGDYYAFTLTRLLDHDIESDGVSPTEIFCLDRETMVPILKGLAVNYPEYLSVTFTHDLDAISLNRDKTPLDVLRLIAGDEVRG